MAKLEVNKTEAWRMLDALRAYKEDYELTEYAIKTIRNLEKKLKNIVNS